MNLQSLMIRASAGSGKTYQLANRFLALLALDVPPARIIALTFTRKAAGEFADRILFRLAEAAASPSQADNLAREIQATLLGDSATNQPGLLPVGSVTLPVLSQARFLELLQSVVASIDRLALGTFDAFFTRIARVSCHELGLGGFALLDEAGLQAEKERIFNRIFSRLGDTASEREAFLQAFKLATIGRQDARFVSELDRFIETHHARFLAQPNEAAWGNREVLWPAGLPWPEIRDFARAADAVRNASETIQWPHASWGKSWQTLLDWFDTYYPGKAEKPPAFIEKLLPELAGMADGSAVFVYSRKDIRVPQPAGTLMAQLLGAYVLAEIILCLEQTRGICKVMGCYENQYGKDVRQRGKLGFSDLTVLLAHADIGGSGPGLDIGYRMDQWFDHWMLDEFQDTNRLQWQVLSALIQELRQEDGSQRTLFVVGDPKQGIHAWRGGEPRLFDEIADDWQGMLPEWSMDKSWRSCKEVLALVNRVCDPSGTWMNERFPKDALERWKFSTHAAGRTELDGESLVIEVSGQGTTPITDDSATGDANDSSENPLWAAVSTLLGQYQPLARGLSCAVLVASNNTARGIADYLRSKMPDLPVEVETETPMAADGPVGAALLDFFRWLHAPEDGFAQGHVQHCPLHAALQRVFDSDIPAQQWQRARIHFARSGASGLLAMLAKELSGLITLDALNAERLESWQLEARRFDAQGGSTGDWLRHLNAWKQREFSQDGAIQIMTVHKSKGLEFDMVILPDLAGKAFDDAGKNDLLIERGTHGEMPFLTLSPNKAIIQADRKLNALFESWCADQCYERFCNLYVAMTRAKHGLYVFLPEPPQNRTNTDLKRSYADWVRDAIDGLPATARRLPRADLPEGAPNASPMNLLWAVGTGDWLHKHPLVSQERQSPQSTPTLQVAHKRVRSRTPSGAKTDKSRASANARSDRRAAMAFGSAVHAAFESLAWLDSPEVPHVSPDSDIQRLVTRCLESPAIRAYFIRPNESVDCWREQAFDVRIGEDWLTGVIDRLHVHRVDGHIVRAVVIDFKTDRIESVAQLGTLYGKQMEAYRCALCQILSLPPEAIDCVLISTYLAQIHHC